MPSRPTGPQLPRVGMSPEAARAGRLHLELALAGYRLAFPKARDPRVEWAPFPSMIRTYWDMVEAGGRGLPPTQAAFSQAVAGQLPGLPAEPVRARACRTFPAFVRQHHFELVLRERFPLVLRGHALDLAGLDFLVLDGGAAYGVALSVETPRAHEWVRYKQRRHAVVSDIPVLELFVDEGLHRAGPFWLHPPDQADAVAVFIDQQRRLIGLRC